MVLPVTVASALEIRTSTDAGKIKFCSRDALPSRKGLIRVRSTKLCPWNFKTSPNNLGSMPLALTVTSLPLSVALSILMVAARRGWVGKESSWVCRVSSSAVMLISPAVSVSLAPTWVSNLAPDVISIVGLALPKIPPSRARAAPSLKFLKV